MTDDNFWADEKTLDLEPLEIIEEIEIPDDAALLSLKMLASLYTQAEEQIAQTEALLARQHKALNRIRNDLIPERMIQAGVKRFILDDGSELAYKPFYKADVLREQAFDWLEGAGYAGAVKQELNLSASRIDKEVLDKIKNYIATLDPDNLSAKEKVSIHHMTMSSILRSLTEQGKDLPTDLFKTYSGNIATLKRGKANGKSSKEE